MKFHNCHCNGVVAGLVCFSNQNGSFYKELKQGWKSKQNKMKLLVLILCTLTKPYFLFSIEQFNNCKLAGLKITTYEAPPIIRLCHITQGYIH